MSSKQMEDKWNMKQSYGPTTSQVGWAAFKRTRRLKWRTRRACDNRTHAYHVLPCDKTKMTSKSSGHLCEFKTQERPRHLISQISIKSLLLSLLLVQLVSRLQDELALLGSHQLAPHHHLRTFSSVSGSLIIGDSAIEIQEVDQSQSPQQQQQQQQTQFDNQESNQLAQDQRQQQTAILGSSSGNQQQPQLQSQNGRAPYEQSGADSGGYTAPDQDQRVHQEKLVHAQHQQQASAEVSRLPGGPLPPLSKPAQEDITDGDSKSRNHHDYELSELERDKEKDALSGVLQPPSTQGDEDGKTITGAVVDFELQPAGGHNKAKIKKKKKKKKVMEKKEEAFKKWGKKKKVEKKAMEKEEKKHMKKKKEEGKKAKKKWGIDEHGQKKKGQFKKKKWGKKVKKGKGVKQGKKGKKFLKDKGHKNTGFKTVYHKEEWGKSNKWHDIKREKKWDEKSKKWKNKWKKEKGKKYKGDHMKKFEKKKKEGKKYEKAKKEKYKKFKKEEYEAGKKKKMEEHKKKKEGGVKKEEKELKKKKKKKKP